MRNRISGLATKAQLLVALGLGLLLTGCGYNDFQRLDESTKSAWSEVLNQYSAAPTWCPTSWRPSRVKPLSSRTR